MRKILDKAFNILFWALIVFIIGFSIFFAVAQRKGDQKYIFGHQCYIVLTGSMEPSIETKSLIAIKKEDIRKIEVGDIISFKVKDTNKVVTHRVSNIIEENNELKLETKGDANNSVDIGYVSEDNLLGKVIKVFPKVGHFSQSIKKVFSYL